MLLHPVIPQLLPINKNLMLVNKKSHMGPMRPKNILIKLTTEAGTDKQFIDVSFVVCNSCGNSGVSTNLRGIEVNTQIPFANKYKIFYKGQLPQDKNYKYLYIINIDNNFDLLQYNGMVYLLHKGNNNPSLLELNRIKNYVYRKYGRTIFI